MKNKNLHNFRHFSHVLALTVVGFGAVTIGAGQAAAQPTFTVTKNVYDGDDWWGTITFRNNGPVATANFQVEFDIPSGKHCTADYVPPGATLSPLTGSGSSARTVSNHCVFTWTNTTTLQPGQSKTFNYSTDTQNFNSASNVRIKDQAVGAICSTFAVTKNVYDGPDWWGTITFKNGGPYNSYNYKVEFDIPSGDHCTNDYVPAGRDAVTADRQRIFGAHGVQPLRVQLVQRQPHRPGRQQDHQLLDRQQQDQLQVGQQPASERSANLRGHPVVHRHGQLLQQLRRPGLLRW